MAMSKDKNYVVIYIILSIKYTRVKNVPLHVVGVIYIILSIKYTRVKNVPLYSHLPCILVKVSL